MSRVSCKFCDEKIKPDWIYAHLAGHLNYAPFTCAFNNCRSSFASEEQFELHADMKHDGVKKLIVYSNPELDAAFENICHLYSKNQLPEISSYYDKISTLCNSIERSVVCLNNADRSCTTETPLVSTRDKSLNMVVTDPLRHKIHLEVLYDKDLSSKVEPTKLTSSNGCKEILPGERSHAKLVFLYQKIVSPSKKNRYTSFYKPKWKLKKNNQEITQENKRKLNSSMLDTATNLKRIKNQFLIPGTSHLLDNNKIVVKKLATITVPKYPYSQIVEDVIKQAVDNFSLKSDEVILTTQQKPCDKIGQIVEYVSRASYAPVGRQTSIAQTLASVKKKMAKKRPDKTACKFLNISQAVAKFGTLQCGKCHKKLANHKPVLERHAISHLNREAAVWFYECLHCPTGKRRTAFRDTMITRHLRDKHNIKPPRIGHDYIDISQLYTHRVTAMVTECFGGNADEPSAAQLVQNDDIRSCDEIINDTRLCCDVKNVLPVCSAPAEELPVSFRSPNNNNVSRITESQFTNLCLGLKVEPEEI